MMEAIWENITKKWIQDLEDKLTTKLSEFERLLAEKEDLEVRLEHWRAVLEDYQGAQRTIVGYEIDSYTSPDYAHMGPTEIVLTWTREHDGNFVVKDAGRATCEAGAFPSQSHAYKILGNTVRRLKGFSKVAPGHFKSHQNGQESLV